MSKESNQTSLAVPSLKKETKVSNLAVLFEFIRPKDRKLRLVLIPLGFTVWFIGG